MKNARFMYLRPGNLFKTFSVERNAETADEFGRPKLCYQESGKALKGCLAQASDNDRERWKQLQHPVTHTIVQAGRPVARVEDRLILGERVFIVRAVDDCGALGITTIYFAEERFDLK